MNKRLFVPASRQQLCSCGSLWAEGAVRPGLTGGTKASPSEYTLNRRLEKRRRKKKRSGIPNETQVSEQVRNQSDPRSIAGLSVTQSGSCTTPTRPGACLSVTPAHEPQRFETASSPVISLKAFSSGFKSSHTHTHNGHPQSLLRPANIPHSLLNMIGEDICVMALLPRCVFLCLHELFIC